MKENKDLSFVNINQISIFLICIQNKGGELSGSIVNFYVKEPVGFSGILDLSLKMDVLCSCMAIPAAATEPRFMNNQMKRAYKERELDKGHILPKYCSRIQNDDRLMALAVRSCETLVIEIHQRQCSSMQGRVKGKCTRGKYISFRSALELMRMLKEYESIRSLRCN